jgi:hypothetical protein
VTPGRLRSGESLVATGAVALVVLLSLDWFGVDRAAGATTGWSALGWPFVVLLVVVLLLAAWLVVATATDAPVERQLLAAVLTASVGAAVLFALTLRVALAQPDLGVGARNADVTVLWPAYLGIVALTVVVAGAWRALADERTDAPESAYVPPPPRPAPPERI